MSNYYSLFSATAALKPDTRKAFYQAIAAKGHIKQGTWNGCAFNAAGEVAKNNSNVGSFTVAAVTFGEPLKRVETFIRNWDQFVSEDATAVLKQILEEIGFDNAATYAAEGEVYVKKPTRIVRKRVFTSYETALFEELQNTAPAALEESPVVQKAFELIS